MLLLRNVIIGVSLLALSACGFEPMHAAKSPNIVTLSHIGITETSNSRESALLKAKTEDLFYRDTASAFTTEKPYELIISLSIIKKATIVDIDGDIRRFRTTVSSPYTLNHKKSGANITTGSISRFISYNTSDDNYAEYISSEDVIKKAVAEIAEEYALRIGAKLSAYQKGQ